MSSRETRPSHRVGLNVRTALVAGVMVCALIVILALPRAGEWSASPAPVAAGWQALAPLFSGRINVLVVTQRSRGRTIYAGVDGGVYKSTDGGETWIPCLEGLSNRMVRALALDPDRPDILYAGTRGGRVYKSEDGGVHWRDISQGLGAEDIVSLLVDPENPDIIHVATPQHLYTTRNGGGAWELAPFVRGEEITQAILDPANPALLYVATRQGKLYYSTDRGAHWAAPSTVAAGLSWVSTSPVQGGTLYAIADGHVWKGEDLGRAWAYNDNYLDKALAQCLAIHPRDASRVLVGTTMGLYRSTDARRTWTPSNQGLDAAHLGINALAYDSIDAETVYLGSGNVVYRSADGGATWKRIGQIADRLGGNVLALVPHPQDAQRMYASAGGGGLFQTVDGGKSWTLLEGLPSAWVTAVGLSPQEPALLYAGTLQGVPYRSQDGGVTWEPNTTRLSGVAITALVVDPELPSDVYLGTWGGGAYISQNWTRGWSRVGSGASYVRGLVLDTRAWRRNLYVLAEDGVYRGEYDSPNQLELTWYLGTVTTLVQSAGSEMKLLAAGDRGADLVEGAAERPEVILVQQGGKPEAPPIHLLAQSPAAPDTLYAAVEGQGVLRSQDLGATWAPVGGGLADRRVTALSIHPASQALYAGTDQGLYQLRGE